MEKENQIVFLQDEDVKEHIAKIVAMRKASGITQSEIAKKSGLSRNGVIRFEKGTGANMDTWYKYMRGVGFCFFIEYYPLSESRKMAKRVLSSPSSSGSESSYTSSSDIQKEHSHSSVE